MSHRGHVDGGKGQGENSLGTGAAGGQPQLVHDGFHRHRVVADNQLAEIVHGLPQGRGQGAAEEGDANALNALVGVQLQGYELPGAGLGHPHDQGVVRRSAQDSGGRFGQSHGSVPPPASSGKAGNLPECTGRLAWNPRGGKPSPSRKRGPESRGGARTTPVSAPTGDGGRWAPAPGSCRGGSGWGPPVPLAPAPVVCSWAQDDGGGLPGLGGGPGRAGCSGCGPVGNRRCKAGPPAFPGSGAGNWAIPAEGSTR